MNAQQHTILNMQKQLQHAYGTQSAQVEALTELHVQTIKEILIRCLQPLHF